MRGVWAAAAAAAVMASGGAGAQAVDPAAPGVAREEAAPVLPPVAPGEAPATEREAAPSGPIGPGGERHFSEAEWRAYAAGRTLYYELDGELVGREYYPEQGDRVVFIYFDGQCFDGSWFMSGRKFCFRYDLTHCFDHIERDGDVFAVEPDGDEQLVVQITDEVLSCEPDILSRRSFPRDSATAAALAMAGRR